MKVNIKGAWITGLQLTLLTKLVMRPLLVIYLMLGITAGCQPAGNSFPRLAKEPNPVIIDERNITGVHVSTRPHNRKVIYHIPSGYWFVFYGHGDKDPDGKYRTSWRSSKDGIHWSERQTAFEGNSHSSSLDVLLSGDKITALIARPHYYREQSGIPEVLGGEPWYKRVDVNFPLPYEICQYDINNGSLVPGPVYSVIPGTYNAFAHYGSLTQDSEGFFWVGARAVIGGENKPFQAWVARSKKANDISAWEPYTTLFRASGKGTVANQVIALDDGKVFSIIFSEADMKVFGSLYDPKSGKWESPYIIAEGNSESKRAVALFDPGTKRLHLVNIDDSGALRHKILSSPYREQDWFPDAGTKVPGILIDSNVITKSRANNNISLSIDTSKIPAPLVVAYHKQTPHYRIRWYNGTEWEKEDFPIGIQEPNRRADEISFIRDYSNKLGLIYCVLPDKKADKGAVHFIEITEKQY